MKLFEYQQEDVDRAAREGQKSIFLAYEQALGKTVAAVEFARRAGVETVASAEHFRADLLLGVAKHDWVGDRPGPVVEGEEHYAADSVPGRRCVRCPSDTGDQHVGSAGEVDEFRRWGHSDFPKQVVEARHLVVRHGDVEVAETRTLRTRRGPSRPGR